MIFIMFCIINAGFYMFNIILLDSCFWPKNRIMNDQNNRKRKPNKMILIGLSYVS